MRVLIACEFSGIVRDAFLERGHDAWSCDLQPTESPIPDRHFQGDVFSFIASTGAQSWDLLIGHPPCTYLSNSSNKHLYIGKKKENGRDEERWRLMREGATFFNILRLANVKRVCLENPIQHCWARESIPKYQQIVQPWMFGHPETKATCLWLKNLPKLQPTQIMPKPHNPKCHFESPGPQRQNNRSRTVRGLAEAMAEQWGSL